MYTSMPSQLNHDEPWLVLFDVSPDIGALAGFFQIGIGRRTVNCATMDSPIEVLKFLQRVKATLHGLQLKAARRHVHLRCNVCIVDRRLGGHVVLHDELGRLVTAAFMDQAYAKNRTDQNAARLNKTAERARTVAQTLVNRLPLTFRPKDRMLKGENPFQVLRLSGFQWMLNRQPDNAPSVNPYANEMQSAAAAYQNNYAVNAASRNMAWRMGGMLRNALEECKPDYIEEMKKQREGFVNNDFMPQVGRGDTPTVAMRLRGFDLLVDRAFQRLDIDRDGFQGLIVRAYRDGLDLTDPTRVRDYIMNWLRQVLPYQKLKSELMLPEPSDALRMFGRDKMSVLRLQLFTPVEPTVPQPDSGTIKTLRIY